MAFETKSHLSHDITEVGSQDDSRPIHHPYHPKGLTRIFDSVRLGLTVVSLLLGLTVVGTAADSIKVYNQTSSPADASSFLSLWPADFSMGPSIAIVVCASIVVLASAVSVLLSKIPSIQSRTLIRHRLNLATPALSLLAATAGTAYFYAVNSSGATDSAQSWSCRWADVDMAVEPHFGRLCREHSAAAGLTAALMPLSALVLALAVVTGAAERKAERHHGKGSPVFA